MCLGVGSALQTRGNCLEPELPISALSSNGNDWRKGREEGKTDVRKIYGTDKNLRATDVLQPCAFMRMRFYKVLTLASCRIVDLCSIHFNVNPSLASDLVVKHHLYSLIPPPAPHGPHHAFAAYNTSTFWRQECFSGHPGYDYSAGYAEYLSGCTAVCDANMDSEEGWFR